ncbi:hypothetical protein [Xenorhabdus siamensis]|uniref:hypothetical protein n=1 Tax=Xenorhabdus siamensis TaxID=3136254 RepID=UPI0030F3E8E9
MAFKILVIDPIHIKLKNYLIKNFNVTIKQQISQQELMECIVYYEILILRSGAKVDNALLDRAVNLKIIIRAGTGTDNINISAVKEKNIIFYNTPNTNSRAVAEMSFGFIHCLYRHIKRAKCLFKMVGVSKKLSPIFANFDFPQTKKQKEGLSYAYPTTNLP